MERGPSLMERVEGTEDRYGRDVDRENNRFVTVHKSADIHGKLKLKWNKTFYSKAEQTPNTLLNRAQLRGKSVVLRESRLLSRIIQMQ